MEHAQPPKAFSSSPGPAILLAYAIGAFVLWRALR